MNNSLGIVICLLLLVVVLVIYSTNFDIFLSGQVSSDTTTNVYTGIFSRIFNAIPYGGYINKLNKNFFNNSPNNNHTNDNQDHTTDHAKLDTEKLDISNQNDQLLLKYLHQKLLKVFEEYSKDHVVSKDIELRIQQMVLIISFDKTFTYNKYEIHIVIHKNQSKYFDNNTLLLIGIHEMTHVVNINKHHDSEFKRIEKEFIDIANKLGYLNSNGIDVDYPCTR